LYTMYPYITTVYPKGVTNYEPLNLRTISEIPARCGN